MDSSQFCRDVGYSVFSAIHRSAVDSFPLTEEGRREGFHRRVPWCVCGGGSARLSLIDVFAFRQVLFETQGRNSRSKSVDLEDMKFHQCVRLARFENDRTISFIPPDGHFDLMNYRLSQVWFPFPRDGGSPPCSPCCCLV